jgi:hypothetical protein
MVIRKMMKNTEIYNIASDLVSLYNQMVKENLKFPVKINFYFQKNMKSLVEMAQEIESERTQIISKYGSPSEDDPATIKIDPDKASEANKELTDFFTLDQEVTINTIDLECFDGIEMTPQQVEAISFMIKEEEE